MDEGTIINQFLKIITDHLDAGYGRIQGDVMWLFRSLVVVQLALSGIFWALGGSAHVAASFFRRVLFIGLILFIVDEFPALVDTLAKTFIQFGINAGGGQVTQEQLRDPGAVATLGWDTARMIWAEIPSLTGPVGTLTNLPEILQLFGAGLVVLVAFFVVAIQVVVAIVSLKLGSLACFVLLPFALFKGTAFMAERPLGWLVASAVRLMLITLVVSVSQALFKKFTFDNPHPIQLREAAGLALGAGIVLVMSFLSTHLARDLASGAPTLDYQDVAAVVKNLTSSTARTVEQVARLVQAAGRSYQQVRAAVNGKSSQQSAYPASPGPNSGHNTGGTSRDT